MGLWASKFESNLIHTPLGANESCTLFRLTNMLEKNQQWPLNMVIPKHLEQEIKNIFDWYIRAACVNTAQ